MYFTRKPTILATLLIILTPFFLVAKPTFVYAQELGVLPFLTSPYFGTTSMTAVFDHQYPVYTGSTPADIPNSIVNRNGTIQIHPPSPPAPTPYENPCAKYSGHSGIDYGLRYEHVIAAHKGKVLQAGWTNPENRRTGLGLRIELERQSTGSDDRISSVYKTRYGHLSSLFVSTNQIVARQELIGISGNTGNSDGPHLHFDVLKLHSNNLFYPVNPYGWLGSKEDGHFATDPWQDFGRPASVNLWQQNPSINTGIAVPPTPANHCSYPTGAALTIPPDHPLLIPNFNTKFHVIIDDLDSRFVANSPIIPAMSNGPWQLAGCYGQPFCFGNTYHYVTKTTQPDLYAAMWNLLPDDLGTFTYDVYAYIPQNNANTNLAYYQIKHNGKTHTAGIDQSRFNQGSYTRRWAYLGRYDFNSQTPSQRVLIYHDGCYNADRTECNPHNAPIVQQQMAADAIAFVLADPPTINVKINGGNNDASRHPSDCALNLQGDNVYLGYCNNGQGIVSGFRYGLINLPTNATITRAHLRFAVDTYNFPPLNLQIYGEYNPNSPAFESTNMPEHPNRLLTTAWVPWNVHHNSAISPPWTLGNTRFSPDLKPLVQEMVNHPTGKQVVRHLLFL